MNGTMNGKPVWSRPARTKEFAFPDEPQAEETLVLSEAKALVQRAIKAGLIKQPKPAPEPRENAGMRSVTQTCRTCGVKFTRHVSIIRDRCVSCRLDPAACTGCGKMFQPIVRKQKCCSDSCRTTVLKRNGMFFAKPKATINCDGCGVAFEKTPGNPRRNCSRVCGFASMAAKNKTKKKK
jgi:hypothetical protein